MLEGKRTTPLVKGGTLTNKQSRARGWQERSFNIHQASCAAWGIHFVLCYLLPLTTFSHAKTRLLHPPHVSHSFQNSKLKTFFISPPIIFLFFNHGAHHKRMRLPGHRWRKWWFGFCEKSQRILWCEGNCCWEQEIGRNLCQCGVRVPALTRKLQTNIK